MTGTLASAYTRFLKWGVSETFDDEMPTNPEGFCDLYSDTNELLARGARRVDGPLEDSSTCHYCDSILDAPNFRPETWRCDSGGKSYFNRGSMVVGHCPNCGWWRASVTRISTTESFGPSYHSSFFAEAIVQQFDIARFDTPLSVLRAHLNKNPRHFAHITPRSFERLVADIYGDFLDCEVRHVGGPGDEGIDAYAIIGDTKHLIQAKRRSDLSACESVSTVREFLGAMLPKRGRKKGHIVTTAGRYSSQAKELASNAELKRFGIEIELETLPDLLKMLGVVQARLEPVWKKL